MYVVEVYENKAGGEVTSGYEEELGPGTRRSRVF
jgi:hypothetical protein